MPKIPKYRGYWHSIKKQIVGQSMTLAPFLFGSWLHRFPRQRKEFIKVYDVVNHNQVHVIGDLYSASAESASTKLRILIPGLSSTHRSPYLARHISQALASNHDVLSLSMRGVLGLGCDLHHAGFTEDLHRIFQDDEFSHYEDITLMGFSMGGLVILNFARECTDSRLKALATLCAPLQLARVQKHLDRPAQAIYRQVLFKSLKQAYIKVWKNASQSPYPLDSDLEAVLACKSFADWDEQVVVSRFPFTSVEDYHRQVSFSEGALKTLLYPSYLLFNDSDPMVRIEDIGVGSGQLNQLCTIGFARGGGHLSFSNKLDLGLHEDLGVAAQLNAWFEHCNSA